MEVDVSHMQPHGAALGDLPGFVQVGPRADGVARQKAQPGAGESEGRDLIVLVCAEEVFQGSVHLDELHVKTRIAA